MHQNNMKNFRTHLGTKAKGKTKWNNKCSATTMSFRTRLYDNFDNMNVVHNYLYFDLKFFFICKFYLLVVFLNRITSRETKSRSVMSLLNNTNG